MTEKPQDTSTELSQEAAEELMRSLLHKEGSWVEWGQACEKLQKAGCDAQTIFERTGFQASQQNLVIVAARVYESLEKSATSPEILSHFQGPYSDVLYEFRILSQEQRAEAAELARLKSLDATAAREVAKAMKEFSRLSQLPAGFCAHPGDAVAYQYWKQARQKKDLQERSRFIARGLKFAHSQTAREQIERLLSDFTAVPSRKAPLMPVYRQEMEDQLPRIVPVAGTLPLTGKDLEAVASLELKEPFRVMTYSGCGTVVPIPGWQVILQALDPVGVFCSSDCLPKLLSDKPEEVLVVIDRQSREWDVNSYFAIEREGQLTFEWFEEPPDLLLGRVILIMRPKKIVDESAIIQPWQMDD